METLTIDNLTVRTNRRRLGNPFKPDPNLRRSGRPHAKLSDYRNSGCDRGHMVPAADMAWGATAMRESFYLSNIAPQEGPDFNRGIWADLERDVRDWLRARGRLVVITGPIFDGGERDETTQKDIPDNRHCQKERIGDAIDVPNRFFKIVYDPERQRVIAFVLPNRRLKREQVKSYRESVDRIEALTGLSFLTGLPPRTQRILKTRKASMWRQSE